MLSALVSLHSLFLHISYQTCVICYIKNIQFGRFMFGRSNKNANYIVACLRRKDNTDVLSFFHEIKN